MCSSAAEAAPVCLEERGVRSEPDGQCPKLPSSVEDPSFNMFLNETYSDNTLKYCNWIEVSFFLTWMQAEFQYLQKMHITGVF